MVINACAGARKSGKDSFGGVAESLVRTGIPAVVAMQFPVTDRAAIVFAREFYATLAQKGAVDEALAEARQAMMALKGGQVEWGAPVLYLRSKSGKLFKGRPDADSPQIEEKVESPGGWASRTAKIAVGALVVASVGTGLFLARDSPAPLSLSLCPPLPGFPDMEFLAVPRELRPAGEGGTGTLCVGKHEVQEQHWLAVMGSLTPGGQKGIGFPATGISLDLAREFVRLLSERAHAKVRLLTEREWKHVAGTGSEKAFFFSSHEDVRDYGNCRGDKDGFEGLAQIGKFKPNPWGFHDFNGNVWELVDSAPTSSNPSGGKRCGGSYEIVPQRCSTNRCDASTSPRSKEATYGLRVAYELTS